MIRDMLGVLGGLLWMIIRFMLIIAMGVGGVYCFGTMFMFPFIWEGAIRLGITAACALGIFGLLRIGRDRDDGPVTEDDFRP